MAANTTLDTENIRNFKKQNQKKTLFLKNSLKNSFQSYKLTLYDFFYGTQKIILIYSSLFFLKKKKGSSTTNIYWTGTVHQILTKIFYVLISLKA